MRTTISLEHRVEGSHRAPTPVGCHSHTTQRNASTVLATLDPMLACCHGSTLDPVLTCCRGARLGSRCSNRVGSSLEADSMAGASPYRTLALRMRSKALLHHHSPPGRPNNRGRWPRLQRRTHPAKCPAALDGESAREAWDACTHGCAAISMEARSISQIPHGTANAGESGLWVATAE